mmetsp:Transcript_15337/g.53282  ORF Transcript_15337/g.53282 Transcript_15337/m.53282 type:complete len:188 (-) Transcript_15337:2160-2723(-)
MEREVKAAEGGDAGVGGGAGGAARSAVSDPGASASAATPARECVWDYPRPPALDPCSLSITVELGGAVVAATSSSFTVKETSHPPTYYLPRSCFASGSLRPSDARGSICEWKGRATYWDVVSGGRVARAAAWSYEDPTPSFRAIKGHVSLYAGQVDTVTVNGERVVPQPGDFCEFTPQRHARTEAGR